MSYWDSSALASLLRSEEQSTLAEDLFAHDDAPTTGWITLIEILATLARWQREDPALGTAAKTLWHTVLDQITLVSSSDDLVALAEDLLSRHALRGMDAIHLASWSHIRADTDPTFPLISFDNRMRDAAIAEGATVLPATLA